MHRLAAPWRAAFNAKPYPGTHRVPHTRPGGGSGGESYPPAGMEAGRGVGGGYGGTIPASIPGVCHTLSIGENGSTTAEYY
jgi:hypothetical protein